MFEGKACAPAWAFLHFGLLPEAKADVEPHGLSTRVIASVANIGPSPLDEVNQMRVADNVQNRADFLAHRAASHPRATELARYFELWLLRLAIDETRYQSLVGVSSEGQNPSR